jgi:hypothetical protein
MYIALIAGVSFEKIRNVAQKGNKLVYSRTKFFNDIIIFFIVIYYKPCLANYTQFLLINKTLFYVFYIFICPLDTGRIYRIMVGLVYGV